MVVRRMLVPLLLVGWTAVAEAQAASEAPPLARDQRRIQVAVATRFVARGDTLQERDFVWRDTVIAWRWGTVGPDTTRVTAGWVARRPIGVGEVLRMPAVSPPPVIQAGTPVKALYQDGAVKLVLSGTATNTAALGAPVGVRIDRGRRLDGIAIGPNTVRLR